VADVGILIVDLLEGTGKKAKTSVRLMCSGKYFVRALYVSPLSITYLVLHFGCELIN
jgi:hypothetical protein